MNKKNDYYFERYLVVFVDILGQKEDLRKMQGIPEDKKELDYFIETIKKTVGKVNFVRDNFTLYFQTLSTKRPDLSLVPAIHHNDFKASLETPNIINYGFSDSFIIGLPLSKLNVNQVANGLHSALTALCAIGLLSLANKIPLRAGLDVGVACKIYDDEIYGQALANAYMLESSIAKYPRFAVGKGLLMCLQSYGNMECNTHRDVVARDTINKCRDFIIKDLDGIYILDYLGKGIKEAFNDELSIDDVIKAWEFIKEEHDKFVEKDNIELQMRYSSLMNYFKFKQGIWGLDFV